jgi:hypothetical protein
MSGLPCLLLVYGYGGRGTVLLSAVGYMIWQALDLSGPAMGSMVSALRPTTTTTPRPCQNFCNGVRRHVCHRRWASHGSRSD